MRNTVFGEVLAELLEEREIPVTPFGVGKLAEEAGLDGWRVINRMADAGAENPDHLDGLADALELSVEERVEFALAYSLERRAGEEGARARAADRRPRSRRKQPRGVLL